MSAGHTPGEAPKNSRELAREHALADAARGKTWDCACGACRVMRASYPEISRTHHLANLFRRESLAASAPDHALIAAALVSGVARWESSLRGTAMGEVCVAGIRYPTSLNPFGVPVLTDDLRAALSTATASR